MEALVSLELSELKYLESQLRKLHQYQYFLHQDREGPAVSAFTIGERILGQVLLAFSEKYLDQELDQEDEEEPSFLTLDVEQRGYEGVWEDAMTQTARNVTTLGHDVIPTNGLEWNKYRKRPVVVSATQMDVPFMVETLEGWSQGQPGDWLVEGVLKELYPCNDAVFRATYESAETNIWDETDWDETDWDEADRD